MRLTVGDQIVDGLLDLFLGLLQTRPTVVHRDYRESKVLHILESKTVFRRPLSNLVLKLGMLSLKVNDYTPLLENDVVEMRHVRLIGIWFVLLRLKLHLSFVPNVARYCKSLLNLGTANTPAFKLAVVAGLLIELRDGVLGGSSHRI